MFTNQGLEPVLIYGAGVCGLAIAQGLRRADIAFQIFDNGQNCAEIGQRARPSETVTLPEHSLIQLRGMLNAELTDRLDTATMSDDHSTISVFNGISGELIDEHTPVDGGCRIREAILTELCQEGIQIKFNHHLQRIEYTTDGNVTACFTNGQAYTGCLIVDTDPAASIVRETLFGMEAARPKPLDAVYSRVILHNLPAAQTKFLRDGATRSNLAVGEDWLVSVSVLDESHSSQLEDGLLEVLICWKKIDNTVLPNAKRHRMIKERAKSMHEPFRSAILEIPDDLEIELSRMESWIPKSWHTRGGRLTIAGPAAQTLPMPGSLEVSNAIADASVFVETIGNVACGNQVRAQAIPALGYKIVARAAKDLQLWQDPILFAINHVTLNDAVITSDDVTLALKASNGPKACLEKSATTSGSDSAKQSRSRRAGSRVRSWLSRKIENLDVGADDGTAQTGWIATAHRQYGKRHFPD